MSRAEVSEREQEWYSVWRALSFCKTYVQVKTGGDPDSHEVCRLLDVCQYLARLNTIVVGEEGVDSSLIDTDDVISAQLLQEILKNPEGAAEVLEGSEAFESFEMVEID